MRARSVPQLQELTGLLLAPGILSPVSDHSQARPLRARPAGGAARQA